MIVWQDEIEKIFWGDEIAKVYFGNDVVFEKNASRLPAGYTEVSYIENTTTARINTGVSGICVWTMTAQLITTTTSSSVLIGRGTAGGHYFGALPSVSNNWSVGASSGQYTSISATIKSDIEVNFSTAKKVTATVGVETATRTASSNSSSNYYLFNGTSSSSYPFKGRLYGDVICTNSSGVVFRGVPCIGPNNEVGLYDIINNVFKGSSNTAVFVAGPAIN